MILVSPVWGAVLLDMLIMCYIVMEVLNIL